MPLSNFFHRFYARIFGLFVVESLFSTSTTAIEHYVKLLIFEKRLFYVFLLDVYVKKHSLL